MRIKTCTTITRNSRGVEEVVFEFEHSIIDMVLRRPEKMTFERSPGSSKWELVGGKPSHISRHFANLCDAATKYSFDFTSSDL